MTSSSTYYANKHTRLFSMRMQYDNLRVIGEAATRAKTTMSKFIRDAIQEKLQREELRNNATTIG